jgi:hypothetical protein
MGEARRRKMRAKDSIDDPEFRRSIFKQAAEQTAKLLTEPTLNDIQSLIEIYRGRNKTLDATADRYAVASKAECKVGCAACCHQMVLCSPFEIFAIVNYLMHTRTAPQIAELRERLLERSKLPLDPNVRYGAQNPCALLESNSCTIYEHRPSVCRTILSASRAACDSCLATGKGDIPQIAEPMFIGTMMQMGIDHALIKNRNLSTDSVELSRALLIALNNFDATISSWLQGDDPFLNCHARPAGFPSNGEMVADAAKRFNVS